ncbi:MAG: hypothetical protein V3R96_02165 [Dehalococcoidales bacterium]
MLNFGLGKGEANVRKGFMAEGVSGQTLRLKASSKVLPIDTSAPP